MTAKFLTGTPTRWSYITAAETWDSEDIPSGAGIWPQGSKLVTSKHWSHRSCRKGLICLILARLLLMHALRIKFGLKIQIDTAAEMTLAVAVGCDNPFWKYRECFARCLKYTFQSWLTFFVLLIYLSCSTALDLYLR